MGEGFPKDPNSIVVSGVDLGETDDRLAEFVDPKNVFRVFFDDRLNRFGEGQDEVEEDVPLLVFHQKGEVDFIRQGWVFVS
jgi:hypothetical protein